VPLLSLADLIAVRFPSNTISLPHFLDPSIIHSLPLLRIQMATLFVLLSTTMLLLAVFNVSTAYARCEPSYGSHINMDDCRVILNGKHLPLADKLGGYRALGDSE